MSEQQPAWKVHNHLLTNSFLPSSIGTTDHCGLWPVEHCPSIFSYLPPTLSIFSLPALEDLFPLPLSMLSWVFHFFSSLPLLEWRYFWASYPPPFSLRDLSSLSFALLSILVYFLLYSSLLVLNSSCGPSCSVKLQNATRFTLQVPQEANNRLTHASTMLRLSNFKLLFI